MVQSRFATYYENHPECYEITTILKKSNEKIKSALKLPVDSPAEKSINVMFLADEQAYLMKSVVLKIELAMLYLDRSNMHLRYL